MRFGITTKIDGTGGNENEDAMTVRRVEVDHVINPCGHHLGSGFIADSSIDVRARRKLSENGCSKKVIMNVKAEAIMPTILGMKL